MWHNHRKIGAQAAKVPHDVPVATESTAVTAIPTTATLLAVIPAFRAKLITDAPTPVVINALAIA